jgi:hypothetical protein
MPGGRPTVSAGEYPGQWRPVPDVASADTTLAFSHRDRLLQADRLIDCTEGSIGPEPGVEYVVKLIAQDTGEEVWSLATSDASIPIPYVTGGSDAAVHALTLQSIRDGLMSLYTFRTLLPAGRYKAVPDHRHPVADHS